MVARSSQLRFMVQFTITFKIQLSFCSTFILLLSDCARRKDQPWVPWDESSSNSTPEDHATSPPPPDRRPFGGARSNNLLTFRPLINSFSPSPKCPHTHLGRGSLVTQRELGSFVQISLARFNLLYCFINVLWPETLARRTTVRMIIIIIMMRLQECAGGQSTKINITGFSFLPFPPWDRRTTTVRWF